MSTKFETKRKNKTERMRELFEAIAEIMWMYAVDMENGKVAKPADSREVIDNSINWAEEFLSLNYNRVWDGEYMEEIEKFYYLKTDQEYKTTTSPKLEE